ncbi:MAG: hypothetical protein WA081_11850 [Desulfosalsimonadaceae bacterium]
MDKVEVKFGEWIERGFNLYKQNFVLLFLVALIGGILSAASLLILSGPMMAGTIMICLKLYDGETPRPEIGTLFRGFDVFLQSVLFLLVWGIGLFVVQGVLLVVPCIGQLAGLCLAVAAWTFLMFGMFLIADRKMDFWPASVESFNVVKTNFWPFLGLSLIASIIGSLGAILCGIGLALTLPVYYCTMTVAYREVFSGQSAPFTPILSKTSDAD